MAYRFGQAEQKVFLVTAKDRGLRATGCSGRREEHLFHPRSMQCRCEDVAAPEVGLQVQGKDFELRAEIAGRERGFVEDAGDPIPAASGPLDGNTAPQAMVDEIADGEPNIGFVTGNARSLQP